MGYSDNPVTVHNNAELLAPLLQGKDYAWTEVENAKKLAYKIRECLRIVRRHPEQFPSLFAVANRYKIEAITGTVTAKFIPELAMNGHAINTAIVLNNPPSDMAIIQAWIEQPEPKKPILVNGCRLSPSEIARLNRWAGQQQPSWRVVEQGVEALRLEPADASP